MMAMKKIALAISMEAPAMPPKPRMPAISATIRNVTTQLSMTRTSVSVSIGAAETTAPSPAETIQAGNDGSGPESREI